MIILHSHLYPQFKMNYFTYFTLLLLLLTKVRYTVLVVYPRWSFLDLAINDTVARPFATTSGKITSHKHPKFPSESSMVIAVEISFNLPPLLSHLVHFLFWWFYNFLAFLTSCKELLIRIRDINQRFTFTPNCKREIQVENFSEQKISR